MLTPPLTATRSLLARSLPMVCGLLVSVVGVLVLVGWSIDVEQLRAVVSGFETMKPLAATCLVLLGAALVLGDSQRLVLRQAVLGAGVIAGGLGVATLGEYVFSTSLGLDALLFRQQVRAEDSETPGRMAAVTAACVALAGGSVVLRRLSHRRTAHLGGWLVSLGASVPLVGYAYGVSSLQRVGPDTSVALHAALSLVVIGVGLVWSTPEHGLVGLARRGPAPSVLIRRALPAIIGVPLALGWVSLEGERGGWYDAEFGVAIMAMGAALTGGLVLWRSASAVAVLDGERARAMADLAGTNTRLEEEVASRTASLVSQATIQQASLEALEQGVVLSTLDGEVLLLNRAGQDLLGLGPEELTALYRSGGWQTYREDGSVMPVEERPLRTTMDSGEPTVGRIIVWHTADGRSVVLRVTTQPVLDEDGQLTGVVTAIADVTAERAAERAAERYLADLAALNGELAEAVAIKDWFLSTASHDMRTPITTIVGFADLLARPDIEVPAKKQLEMLEAIKRQGRRLEALVEDLLSIAVIDAGAVNLAPEMVELGPVLRQIAADAGLDSEIEVRSPGGTVAYVDPMRLAQMVTNLLQNAARYGRPPISTSAVADGDWVNIRISDHGPGVDPAFVPKMFERFSTTNRGVAAGAPGTGLGLAIVRGLAHAHGGEVSHEPNEPTGACFVLRLPAGPPTEPLDVEVALDSASNAS